MAIIQISKIQQRSGDLVDLPQLDEAEFGWASDAKRLFIGKTVPNENIEVLTAYSKISYSQLDGAVGNLNVNPLTISDGQLLGYKGTSWVNLGGNAGGLITLGNVANVKITGGSTGFILQTDGTGNLSWTPSGVLATYIQNVTKANPAVVTTTQDNFFVDGAQITITNAQGMTDLNGKTYYANVISSNTFSLYSDAGLTTPVNSSAYNAYSYTSVSATTTATNIITVGNSTQFSVNAPVRFVGSMSTSGILNGVTYYIKTKPSGTQITISNELLANGSAGNTLPLQTTSGLSANVYQEGGRAVSTFGSGSSIGVANGTSTMVQFNTGGLLDASSDFTFDKTASPKLLTVNGNANIGNLNATGTVTATRFISNVSTGTAPFVVSSTTTVANLSATTATTAGTVTTNAQPNITSVGTLTSLTVTGNVTAGNLIGPYANGNSNVNIPAANGNVNISAVGNANILVVTGTGANISGTLNATGNITGGNLVTAGALSVTGNANVGNIGASSGVFTANVTAGNMFANSGQVRGGNVTSLGYFYRSVTTGLSAAGTQQSNAATFATEIVEFSTVNSGAGAILPTAVGGMVITIVNTSGNTLNVYPATGAKINSLATNAAYTQVAGATLQYIALDSTRWYTVGATFA
jgi:hypothetical protein